MSRVGWRWDHRVLDTFQNAKERVGDAFVRVRNWFSDASDAIRSRPAGLRSVAVIASAIAAVGLGVIAFGIEGRAAANRLLPSSGHQSRHPREY
jgi:hypothetical protein